MAHALKCGSAVYNPPIVRKLCHQSGRLDAANGNETHFCMGYAFRAISWAVIGAVASSLSLQLSHLLGHALFVPALGAGFGKRFGRLPRRMPFLEAAREWT